MYLKINKIKAIEKQKSSYLLVIDNKINKIGEYIYWINEDAFNIIKQMDGTRTKKEIAKSMCQSKEHLIDEAEVNLNTFIKTLEEMYGFVVEYLDESRKYAVPILGNGKTQYPSEISIEITHKCNAKCLHCYGDYSCSNEYIENIEGIKKLLKDSRKSGTRVVEFTGGEVTCHPQFKDILNYAYNLDFNVVSILSNGLFWDEKLFRTIEKNKEKTVVQIDLHGDNDEYINWFMGTNLKNITERIKKQLKKYMIWEY